MSIVKYFFVPLLFVANGLFAQSELSSYFLVNAPASQYLNPSFRTDAKLSWGLPNAYYVHGNRGLNVVGIITDNVLDFSGIGGSLKEENGFLYGIQGSLGSFHFNYDQFSFHVGHNMKGLAAFNYNDNLYDLLKNGNAQYIGQYVNIGPSLELDIYSELYFGMGVTIQQFQVGARIKRYNGFINAFTPQHDFTVFTNEEIYQLEFQNNYQFNTNLGSEEFTLRSVLSSIWDNYWGNPGWGLDIGMKASIGEDFILSASMLDMGLINWNRSAKQYSTEGNYTFEGYDLVDLITDEQFKFNFDSLKTIVEVEEVNEDYHSSLPVQFYLGVQYNINQSWELNSLFYNAYSSGMATPAFMLMGKYKASPFFHSSFSYTWNRFNSFNFGLSLETHYKWFHAYLSMDNLPGIFRPVSGSYFNIRFGVQVDLMQ